MFPRHTKSTETGLGEVLEVIASDFDPAVASPAVMIALYLWLRMLKVGERTRVRVNLLPRHLIYRLKCCQLN